MILINVGNVQTITPKQFHMALERVRNGTILHQALRTCLRTMHTKDSSLVVIPIVWLCRSIEDSAMYHMSLVIIDCRFQTGGIQWFFNPVDEKTDPLSVLTELMKKEAPFIHGFLVRTLPSLDIPAQSQTDNTSVFQCILLASLLWTMEPEPHFTEYIHRALKYWIEGNELNELRTWVNSIIGMALQSSMPLQASYLKLSKADIYSPLVLSPTVHTVDSDAV